MNRKQLVQLGGISGATGGAVMLGGVLSTLFVRVGPYEDSLVFPFFQVGLFLVGLGVLGIGRLQEPAPSLRVGGMLKVAVILAVLGLLGLIGGTILANFVEALWYMFFSGFLVLCLCSAALGIALFQAQPNLRLQAVLLIVGAALMPMLNTTNEYIWFSAPFAVAWLVMGVTLALTQHRSSMKPAL